ncbi:MAG: trimethylamine methyltransferase family protein [Sphingomonadaceae bacterium]
MLKIPSRPLAALSEDQVEVIHLASLRLLEEVGVEMLDDRALDLVEGKGALVDWPARRARLPRELVMEAVARAPERFTLHGRDPNRSVEVGGDGMVLVPVGGPSMVSSMDEGRRPGSYADQVRFIQLTHQSPLLDLTYRCVEALDLPATTRHLDFLYAAIRYSDKPLGVMGLDGAGAEDALAVAALLVGGEVALRGRPAVLGGVNVDSPLRFSRETLEAIVAFAGAGQPLKITPFILTGVMSPVTSAGSLAQQNAEVLAGVALAELVNPGTPVLYGSFGSSGDMRSGSPLFGNPEGVQMEVAAGQLARRYRLPHRGMGLVTSSPTCDAQAAIEKMSCLWGLTLSNTHMLLHAAGWLEGGVTASYEQFALDLEMLASMERFIEGIRVDGESLALDTVAQVGPGGSFLMSDHTLANYRDALRISPLVESRPYDGWQAEGAPTVLERANALWKEWLRQYQPPPIDPALEEAVLEYVRRRKAAHPSPE